MSSKVLVVGQTPPPFGGQSVMIAHLLEHDYGSVELIHVRMAFSREMDEVGTFRPRKLIELLRVILNIWQVRFRSGARILYYPPAGPDLVPILRDVIILLSVRPLFDKTILHFHAGGLSEALPRLPFWLRPLARIAYARPDAAIRLSDQAPPDGAGLLARREFIVPYGILDQSKTTSKPAPSPVPIILLVGILRESKGVMILLEACRLLAKDNLRFRANLMGTFQSSSFERQAREFIARHGLAEHVHVLGVQTGEAKDEFFTAADIFCFPTFFESETFGVVLLEAMSFSLPIVATQWRGVPSLVEEGVNGFLVPIKDPIAVAERLKRLIQDPDLRHRMGTSGRQRFLEEYTLEKYHQRLQGVFESVCT